MKQNVKTGNERKLMPSLITLVLVFTSLGLASCKWSAQDYGEINSIKTAALELVDKSATEAFIDHKDDVQKIDQRITKIINNNKPKIGVRMLTIIYNKERHTWGGFTKFWESSGKLTKTEAIDAKKNIEMAFAEALAIGKSGVNPEVIQ